MRLNERLVKLESKYQTTPLVHLCFQEPNETSEQALKRQGLIPAPSDTVLFVRWRDYPTQGSNAIPLATRSATFA